MTRLTTFVAAAAALCLVAPLSPVSAQTAVRTPQATLARAGSAGSIQGLVLDTQGKPLVGAMVSALGSTVAFALTGRDGRFLFDALPAGAYAVRVHLDGYAPSQRQLVDVHGSGAPSMVSVALRALAGSASPDHGPVVLAAGMVPVPGSVQVSEGDAASADADHSHSETAWRLRHLKRSVLKNADSPLVIADDLAAAEPDAGGSFFGRAFESSARMAASFFGDLPLSGQVNFITTGTFTGTTDLWSPNALAAASIAYVSVGSSAGSLGNWSVRGAMTQGNLGSWFLAGSLAARPSSAHRYVAGMTYSSQRYSGADAFAVAAIAGGARALGTVYGFDEWIMSPRLSVGYGLTYAWQDFLQGDGLLSPRLSVTMSPLDHTRLRTVVARTSMAPGSDEFLPASGGPADLWLPSQRSFSPWSDRVGLRPQTTAHYEFGVERDVAAYVIGFRTFFQRVDDQAGALFALPTIEHPAATLGHYYVANLGDLETRGWSVRVTRPILGSVRGSVDYSLTRARWQNIAEEAAGAWYGGARRAEFERVHDLTTSVETDISQTATRVFVLYKINSGFARPSLDARAPGLDGRFDVQVNQALPFLAFTSADWEVLVSVCNLFREMTGERSVYDELLVVRPPKRVVGGVRVRF